MSASKPPVISPWQWALGAAVIAALVAGWFLLPIKEWSDAFQAWTKGLGPWGWLIFAAVYIVSTVLLVPVSVLTIAAGLAFGLAIGFPLVVVSATIGATLAFLVARYLAHDKVESLMQKRPKFKAIQSAVSEGGWKVVALLRLSPVLPFNLQNYFYGITDVKLLDYVAATFFGIMPGTLLYVYLGAAGKAASGEGASTLKWGFFAVGLVATVLVAVFVTKKAKAKLKEHGVGQEDGEQGGNDGGAAAQKARASKAPSMKPLQVDLCVIGAGSAGLSATAFAAQLGVNVVLVERGKMGGECLNIGCVPSKALLAAAKVAHAMRSAAPFGITAVEPQVDFAAVHAHVQRVITAIAPHDSVERFEGLGATVIRGDARFVGPRELVVSGESGEQRISARRVIIATGSGPALPQIDGLASVPYFTNETLFDNQTLPEHLLILGGGPIGIEMAQAHRRLGAKVTVIERLRCLSNDDEEHAALLLQRLAAEGVVVRQNTGVTAVRQGPRGIVLSLDEGGQKSEIEGSHLLVATGRSPRVDALGLDRAGVTVEKGGIVVDAKLRTNVHGVYAIGDVVAKAPHFTHIAAYHAGIAVQNALLLPYAKTDYGSLPWVTYGDPELAHVGVSEADARTLHGDDVQLLRFEIKANDRAQTELATLGSVKVWTRKNGQVLGVSILAAHAGEMAHLWSLAIRSGLKLKAIASMIAPYPTFGEASKSAAGELYKPKLFSPLAKRVVRLFSHLP